MNNHHPMAYDQNEMRVVQQRGLVKASVIDAASGSGSCLLQSFSWAAAEDCGKRRFIPLAVGETLSYA